MRFMCLSCQSLNGFRLQPDNFKFRFFKMAFAEKTHKCDV